MLNFDLAPMHELASRELLAEWAHGGGGMAAITGSKAKNLNPLVHEGRGDRTLSLGWWWLWPDKHGPARFTAFNARVERLAQSAVWRPAFQRRALLPANWYVEKKVRFEQPDATEFGIAAIVNPVTLPDGSELLSYAMVTRAAVGAAATTHPRMPLAPPRSAYDAWLDPQRTGDDGFAAWANGESEEISRVMVPVASPGGGQVKRAAESVTPPLWT